MKVTLFEIFKIYFVIGLQLIGGGYVIVPLLKKYLVEDKKWLTNDMLIDYLVLSQSLPGIITINISIFSGFALRKIKGAIAAILGLLLPSFTVIIIAAGFLNKIANNQIVQNAFYGIRISIIVLIFYMIYDIFKTSIKTSFSILLFIFILLLINFTTLTPGILIIISIFIALLNARGDKNV